MTNHIEELEAKAAAAAEFYGNWIAKEEANLDSAKRELISYTEMLNKSITDENWTQVTEMGSKVANASFRISTAASELDYYTEQLDYYTEQLGHIQDAMFDAGHPGHESK
mgnify:CR=1 FL=1